MRTSSLLAKCLLPFLQVAHGFVVPNTNEWIKRHDYHSPPTPRSTTTQRNGWVENNGEWEWQEDDPNYIEPPVVLATATPRLPSGQYKPKQSLGQNYLKDPNTVAKIVRAFHRDAMAQQNQNNNNNTLNSRIVELGPGAGALTDKLVETYGVEHLHCIEIDARSVQLLTDKHAGLSISHADVLQVDYPQLVVQLNQQQQQKPLTVIGNLPYYITSQILFCLADASHAGSIQSATVTMQYEVAQRLVAPTSCKEYGILSVVFQLYAATTLHFKIPPTVFYPQPKVNSALVGLQFIGPTLLQQRLCGVRPCDLRLIVTKAFQQRRKTVRNSLKTLLHDNSHVFAQPPPPLPPSIAAMARDGDAFAATQALPENWASRRPEELTPGQFVELTGLLLGRENVVDAPLGNKVWRKLKHGSNQ